MTAAIERGRHYPAPAPALEGESDAAYTDRITGADRTDRKPYDHARYRECSMGYHTTCSDPDGCSCGCPCHHDRPAKDVEVTQAAVALGGLYYLPEPSAQRIVGLAAAAVIAARTGTRTTAEAVKNVLSNSYPGGITDWFVTDVMLVLRDHPVMEADAIVSTDA